MSFVINIKPRLVGDFQSVEPGTFVDFPDQGSSCLTEVDSELGPEPGILNKVI